MRLRRATTLSLKFSISGKDGGALLAWYDQNRRELPWRKTQDPYAVWVSEIMLQQTQVSTVVPYWERWMQTFPTVESLASADEQDVLSIWQGLGYYRRCRMLLAGSRWVLDHGMPIDVEGWLCVPGVGQYTARAIASIAQGVAAPVVDGNVERVYARLAGDDRLGKELHAAAWDWAHQNLFASRPGDWNQALMELGATVCTPNRPACGSCPLEDRCVARQSWRVDDLPTKPPKMRVVKLRQSVWVPIHQGQFGLRQIPAGQWWEGMWEFPRIDWVAETEPSELRELCGGGWLEYSGTVRHSVTCHRIAIDVSFLRCDDRSDRLHWYDTASLAKLPMPSPQRRILKLILNQLGLPTTDPS
ncbi:MAG: A/G-specific adenine glycosylase [Fimbriimonas sp.]|nr:A/G-specific adenine glycosylase [Fimbriimonas sp.]